MQRVRRALRDHLHFVVVTTVLTLVMTFPTIVYVFRTDVFWLPTGDSTDVFTKLWDVWHGRQLLNGQAEYYFTNKMFYPDGVSLVYHPFFVLHVIVVNALQLFMPISNAYSLTYIFSVMTCTMSAYVYVNYLVRDRWVAVLGAAVFGFSPHVVGHPNHPSVAFVATLPLALFFLHRGISEDRRAWIVCAGVLTGFTAYVTMYSYVCLLITMGLYGLALALPRWRDKGFWLKVCLLLLVIVLTSAWRLYPMLADSQSATAALEWHGDRDYRDLVSAFVNPYHPVLGPLFGSLLQTPAEASVTEESYLGFVPLLLIGIGMYNGATRQKMMPWLVPFALFFVLRLGTILSINGVTFPEIVLPKHFFDQILPIVFKAFSDSDHFQIGVLLPLAVLSSYGVATLIKRVSAVNRPRLILFLVVIIAIEYYIPVRDGIVSDEQTAFLDWLATDNSDEIRLINMPMGRSNSQTYNLYQLLSGYPHVEGAISRTPDVAFNYIRANPVLHTWYQNEAVSCETVARDDYLAALQRMQADGFSHVVYHRWFHEADDIAGSFQSAAPSYSDDYVSIYRLDDLRAGCR